MFVILIVYVLVSPSFVSFFSDVLIISKVVSFITPVTLTLVVSFGFTSLVFVPFAIAVFVVILSSSLSTYSTLYEILYISPFSIIGIVMLRLLSLLLFLSFHTILFLISSIFFIVLFSSLLLTILMLSLTYLAFPLSTSLTFTSLAL